MIDKTVSLTVLLSILLVVCAFSQSALLWRVRKHEQAIATYQQAARLGSSFAQQLLLSNGTSW